MSAHPRSKLSESNVVAILEMAATGERSGVISASFGVGKNTVIDILSGRTWKHIPRPDLPVRQTGAYERKSKYGPLCSIPGCDKPTDARGWCTNHWARWKAHGDPLAGRTPPGEPQRFLDDALQSQIDECIIWPYARTKSGYAQISVNGRQMIASRIVCKAKHGNPPTRHHQAAHSCGNGRGGCINPGHLRWATPAENNADKIEHGTVLTGEDHPSAKLTWDDVLEIRSLSGSMSQSKLGDIFGVKQGTIRDILSHRSWREPQDAAAIRALGGGEG